MRSADAPSANRLALPKDNAMSRLAKFSPSRRLWQKYLYTLTIKSI
jgi:hypothetical protein